MVVAFSVESLHVEPARRPVELRLVELDALDTEVLLDGRLRNEAGIGNEQRIVKDLRVDRPFVEDAVLKEDLIDRVSRRVAQNIDRGAAADVARRLHFEV